MRTQDLSLEHHEARIVRPLAALERSVDTRARGGQRLLAIVLLGQLALSCLLVVIMASRSPINAHPDEGLHLDAGRYFVDHWLPTAVGTPDAAPSYSKYGRSYVDEADIVYWM